MTLGLLKAEDAPSDAEVAEFIFHPGFSHRDGGHPARGPRRRHGRGQERDRRARRPRRALERAGRGTTFTIYLPLTLAVTQAVMVRAGGVHVRHPRGDDRAGPTGEARTNSRTFQTAGEAQWQNRRYPFRYLPRLLGDTSHEPEAQRVHAGDVPAHRARTWLRSSSTRSFGNQEIVVKNTGPLLARVAGITGATVLGTGEIVLIINPVILAGRERDASSAPARGGAGRDDAWHARPPRGSCRR